MGSIVSTYWCLVMRGLLKELIGLLFKIRVTGYDNIPAGGYILVANHLNWLDGFLLLAFFPTKPTLYILADMRTIHKQWWRRVIVGSVGRIITIDRSRRTADGSALKKAQRVLDRGEVLALFPEGKVGSTEGKVGELKRGVGALCMRSGRPVLPVGLSGVSELYLGKEIIITIGRVITPVSIEPTIPARIDDMTRQVQRALDETVPPYQEKLVSHKPMRWLSRLF